MFNKIEEIVVKTFGIQITSTKSGDRYVFAGGLYEY